MAYGHRPIETRAQLAAQLAWLSDAVHDRKMDSRLLIEAIVDTIVAVVDLMPGPPVNPGPPA